MDELIGVMHEDRLRYLRALCQQLVRAPFETVMGNVYSARQAVNLYGFVRFAREPELAVEDVLSDFVRQVARPSGEALLCDLLIYLENRDPWHEDMPEYRRLPALPEAGIRVAQLRAALPELAHHLLADTPLLLNGARDFARTVEAALDLHTDE